MPRSILIMGAVVAALVSVASYSFIPWPWGILVAVGSALGGLWLVKEWVRSLPERPGEDDGL